jgi:cell wall-associated NlpC family hydrolase
MTYTLKLKLYEVQAEMFAATHVVVKNVVNLYEQPNSSSPLDTQALMGESVQVDKKEDGFFHVITGGDLYGGWMDSKWVVNVKEIPRLQTGIVKRLFAEVFLKPDRSSELITKLVMGTRVLLAESQDSSIYVKLMLPNAQSGYVQRSSIQTKPLSLPAAGNTEKTLSAASARAVQIAKQLIGTPYLWGGTTPFGIDCSGLVQLSYKMCGVNLRRNSYMQMSDRRFSEIEAGKALNEGEFLPGDVLGFDMSGVGPKGKINHVALALGDGRFIHASGWQRRGAVFIESCKDPTFVELYTSAIRLASDATIESA